MTMTTKYLETTSILNYQDVSIQNLIEQRQWCELTKEQALKSVYYFIRDEIKFGYNSDDAISASEVLSDGYGQCNTKSTLFMALLRSLDIPCRFHGFTIFNALQRGAIPNYLMFLAPQRILHSWVEVQLDGKWFNHEGFIIDDVLLKKIQRAFPNKKQFSGYGIDVPNLQKPTNEYHGDSTYIQSGGIADDFGVFNAPDEFYQKYGSNLRGLKKYLYRYVVRHIMNNNVKRLRQNGLKV